MTITPELLIAGVTVLGTITGALVGQLPAFLSRRMETRKQAYDQRDRWEARSFELSEQILQNASQLDAALRRKYDLEIEETIRTGKLASLEAHQEMVYLGGGKEVMPELLQAREDFAQFKEELAQMRRGLDEGARGNVDSIWALKGPLSTYLNAESHVALIELAFEAEKRLKSHASQDLDGAILTFSVSLRESFQRASQEGGRRGLGEWLRSKALPGRRG